MGYLYSGITDTDEERDKVFQNNLISFASKMFSHISILCSCHRFVHQLFFSVFQSAILQFILRCKTDDDSIEILTINEVQSVLVWLGQ